MQLPDRGIGFQGKLLSRLPEDMQFFTETTTVGGKDKNAIIMGRATLDSIPKKFKPLPDRTNIIVSKNWLQIMAEYPGTYGFDSPEKALGFAKEYFENIWIGGGAEIYKALLHECQRLYITETPYEKEADRFFPDFKNQFEMKEVLQEGAGYVIKLYERK